MKSLIVAGLAVAASASKCANVLAPSYNTPVVASGWTAQIVANGLTKPRSIQFDKAGGLLVLESGKGLSRLVFKDNGNTCLEVTSKSLVVNDTTLNHGLALSSDQSVVLVSSAAAVHGYAYDATAGTVSGSPRTLVDGMRNSDLTTRTLLVSQKQTSTLLVSRGSGEDYDVSAMNASTGLSQIRAFDLGRFYGSSASASAAAYDFGTGGLRLGWGLRNSVGVAEHPGTGEIYAVDNGIDAAVRDGVDIHQDNPGEELNALGPLSNLSTTSQGGNFGYPNCFAVWDTAIPDNTSLVVGQPVSMILNSTYNDTTCAATTIAPRLTFPAHMAPLGLLFSADGATAYVTFHGSTGKTSRVGYHVASVAFNNSTGAPVAAATSTTALTDIITNPDLTKCPGSCFRPVGLAWDSAGRLFMSSDTTGEIFVLQKAANAATAGTMVTSKSAAADRLSHGSAALGAGIAAAVMAVLAM